MIRRETPTRGRGIEEGLAARLHDPLWMLARQWQFGEFRHENTGSPVWVEVASEVHPLDEWRRGDGDSWQPYAVEFSPLERVVEEHGGRPSPRLRLEGGLRLARMLAAAGFAGDLAAFAALCPFPESGLVDAADALIRDGLPDGVPLAASLERLLTPDSRDDEIEALKAKGEISSSAAQLGELAREWLTWWSARLPSPVPEAQDCWDEHRLEHAFALRAAGLPSVELRATEYPGGRLDWPAVDAFEVEGDAAAAAQPLRIEQRGVPAPARFGGMPATRFWEMEDARFDPGSVDAAPIDLGRLMLIAYATVYGNDWFVVPIRMPVASLSRVTRFEVHDVFGEKTTLDALGTDQDGWSLFGLSLSGQEPTVGEEGELVRERPTSPWFLLAPSLPASLESAPTDIAMLFRDEMANLAWAVEAVVGDDHGRPLDRFAEWAGRDAPAPVAGEVPAYRVETEVPHHWFPLLPERFENEESVRLRLATLTRIIDGKPVGLEPTGSLLRWSDPWLYEEEVPRSGVQVTRAWQYARWSDGSRHLWQARRKLSGRGEGSSGLRFDQVDDGSS